MEQSAEILELCAIVNYHSENGRKIEGGAEGYYCEYVELRYCFIQYTISLV